MMTRELALGMMRQAETGEQMLTVADAICGMAEEMNIADAAAHFDQLNDDAYASDGYFPEEEFAPTIEPEDEPEHVMDPEFAAL